MESIDQVTSPLFPQAVLSPETSIKLPPKPLAHSGSVQLYLILAEKSLYVQGFEEAEYADRPPAILRGSLFLRITKPVKIKFINLKFSGVAKTDWPEGIPPKKTEYQEVHQLIQHTWPFFNSNMTMGDPNKGASIYKPLDSPADEISSFSLEPTLTSKDSSSSIANVLRRAASPSPARSRSNTTNTAVATASSLFSHLTGSVSNIGDIPSANDLQSVKSIETIGDPNAMRTFQPGDYIYSFELPIPPSTPESMSVTFGSVTYSLEATVERAGAFKTSLYGKEIIDIIRTPSDYSQEDSEPIAIVRDWEDRLRYEIVIASKAIVLNTYLPLAFKLTPLEKIQLHRIRVYLTENLEYYCRHKKIHRLEPTKKYLLLEHKPGDGETSLLGDEEITARELEFQLYVPERLGDRQKLHPDTSYANIQSHHWIKICLRLSKPEPTEENPQKRKHYEISIDSPIHILSPLATHANTLLPSYDQPAPLSTDYLRNPPQSPNVIAIDNSLDAMISPSGYSYDQQDPYYVPPDMHLNANIYKPENLVPELQSPQAQPFSPVISPEMAALSPHLHSAANSPYVQGINSPMARPIHLLRRPSNNPPPFEADAAPPPCDDEPPAYAEHDINTPTIEIDNTEEDIGDAFEFTRLSPRLSLARAASPAPRSRSTSLLRAPGSVEHRGRSPRGKSPVPPLESQSGTSKTPAAQLHSAPQNRIMPKTAESFLTDFDDEEDDVVQHQTSRFHGEFVPENASSNNEIRSPIPQSPVPVAGSALTNANGGHATALTAEALSPTLSVTSSVNSTSTKETQFDPIGEPLLNSTTSTSTIDQRPAMSRDRFQSTQSTDITSMYSLGNNNASYQSLQNSNQQRSESIWHPLDSDFTHINNPHLFKKPAFNKKYVSQEAEAEDLPSLDSTQRQMSFGVESVKTSSAGAPLDHTASQSTITATQPKPKQAPPPPVPRHVRVSRSASSASNSAASNNSSLTLKSNDSSVTNEDHTDSNAHAGSLEVRKLSSTSSNRPTLSQDTTTI